MAIHRDLSLCHPKARARFTALGDDLIRAYEAGETKTLFKVFETFRDPVRQNQMVAEGSSKARAWQGAHNYGLAVDYVPYVTAAASREAAEDGVVLAVGWNWHPANDYRFLAARAKQFDLTVPISWDLVHVEVPDWSRIRKAFEAAIR